MLDGSKEVVLGRYVPLVINIIRGEVTNEWGKLEQDAWVGTMRLR